MSIRKKLEPLEDYVPAVILTQLQIKDIGGFSSFQLIVFVVDLIIYIYSNVLVKLFSFCLLSESVQLF